MGGVSISNRALSIREGLIIGLIGAVVVASCYLVADWIRGVPLLTPSVLGEVILYRQHTPSLAPDYGMAARYTLFHLTVFAVFGIAIGTLAGWARSNAVARYAMVQLFVVFVLFAWGVLALMSDATKGLFPIWLVLGANLLAAIFMGLWLWIQHPSLRAAMRTNPLGGSDKDDITNVIRIGSPHRPPVR